MKKTLITLFSVLLLLVSCGPKDGTYTLHLLTTNDVHGHFFDSTYVDDRIQGSLLTVSYYADSLRNEWGKENVILVDAGDCLQGDNAAYYFNYVDTTSVHLYARMVDYIGYDAVTVGNHDIETGHSVYDRLDAQMKTPFLAANAIREDNGKPYFQTHTIVKKGGLKVAILGFTNPNMKNWLSPLLFEGMYFENLLPFVQKDVDAVIAEENPHVVIVSIHSGTGDGDGSQLESQGLDLFNSLTGVDFIVCSHDHRPVTHKKEGTCLINAGSHCRNLGHGAVTVEVKDGKVVAKSHEADLIRLDWSKVNEEMRETFRPEYEAVKAFTLKEVGELKSDLVTRDSYAGMSDYINLIHTLSLSCEPAQISFAAPLTFNGTVKAGTLIFNDLFTIYPFENQLYVVEMTGKEIKDYLEYSYESWVYSNKENVLKITDEPDPRTGQKRWSFVGRSYNFDSAAGINYTVDVTKPYGERVEIESLADGSPYDEAAKYNVAMTSYRASGGGGHLKAVGIDTDRIDERVKAYHPEIRNILYDYLLENKVIDPAVTGDKSLIGEWKFVPEKKAQKAIEKDMQLLFGRR